MLRPDDSEANPVSSFLWNKGSQSTKLTTHIHNMFVAKVKNKWSSAPTPPAVLRHRDWFAVCVQTRGGLEFSLFLGVSIR